MGLDLVELVMATEEAFGITIQDSDAARLRTPRDVIDYVFAIVGGQSGSETRCLTQKAFYKIRRAVADSLDVPRRTIRPESKFDSLFPARSRIRIWEDLTVRRGVPRLPALVRPAWCNWLLGLAFLLFFAGFTWLARDLDRTSPYLFAFVGACAVQWTFFKLTTPLKREFVPSNRTVGALSASVASDFPRLLWGAGEWPSREQVRDTVRKIIRNVLGTEDDFPDEADFERDLGVA